MVEVRVDEDNLWRGEGGGVEGGVNEEWGVKVGYGWMEVDEGVGVMDMDVERERKE